MRKRVARVKPGWLNVAKAKDGRERRDQQDTDTVTLMRKHRNENRQLAVSISNTEMPLHFVLRTVGTGNITNKSVVSEKHTPSYVYAVYNRQALALLEKITPYLRTYKQRRARLILDNYVNLTARNGKYSKELASRRKIFEDTVLATKTN